MTQGRGARTLAGLFVLASAFGAPACSSEPGPEARARIEDAKVDQTPVPDVHGRIEEQARSLLEALGFELEIETQLFPGSPPGRVVSQEPPAGTLAQKGSRVTLVISSDSEE